MSQTKATQTSAAAQRFDEVRAPVEGGRSLIEASAGTGKTFALVALFLRLVLEGREAGRLLVVTFTVAATEELTQRIREGLRVARAVFEGRPGPRPALAELMRRLEERFAKTSEERRQSAKRLHAAQAAAGDLSVYTIHGFCKHALEEWAFESGTPFRIDFAENADELLRRAAASVWRERVAGAPLLSEAAVALEWDLGEMLAHLAKTERHAGTVVVPPATLGEALPALEGALRRLQRAWDAEALTPRLERFVWTSKAPLTAEDVPEAVRAVARCADGQLSAGLEAVRTFTPDALERHANKRRTDRDLLSETRALGGPQACAEVVAATERLEKAFVRWFTEAVPGRFRALKRRAGVMTFDDLLAELLRALTDEERGAPLAAAIRARYDAALVDEFQDTDPRQYAIFKKIFGGGPEGKPVFLIGDAKQAIYRFRGADLHTYLGARREARRRFTLGKNWRSQTRLVRAVNALFEQAPAPFLHEDIPFNPVEAAGRADDTPLADPAGKAPLVWWYHPPQQARGGRLKAASKTNARPRITRATAGEIARLLGKGNAGSSNASGDYASNGGGALLGERPLRADDIAVLVRSNGQAKKMQAALQARGVPAVVSATRSILETREMAELETLLRAALEPRPERIAAALATEMWGFDAGEIYDAKEDAARWAGFERQLGRYGRDWQRRGVAYCLTRFLDEENVRERLLSFEDGARRLTNVRHAVELLREAEARRQQAPSGLLRWLARREETRILEGEEAELRLETDERAVQVLTLHKSKGLEFNVVFCPFLWHTYFDKKQHPLVRAESGGAAARPNGDAAGGRVVYDIGSAEREAHLERARAEQLAEELRLAYVGLTRAVHRCYVAWGDLRSAPQSALGYLLHAARADLADAQTPVERAAAVRHAARRVQAASEEPDTLRQRFGECEHMAIETLAEVEAQAAPPAPSGAAGSNGEAESNGEARGDNTDGASLQPRRAAPELQQRLTPWTYASYSSWTRGARGGGGHAPAPPEAEEHEPDERAAFAAGLQAGRCLHEILERVDLATAPEDERNARWVRRLLRRHRLGAPSAHRRPVDPEAVVTGMLRALRTVAWPGASFTLADVGRGDRASEWSFSLPAPAGAEASSLRAVFAEEGGALAQEYAARLGDLRAGATRWCAELPAPQPLGGFLRGTADLVFEKEGAYYLVGWKSNRLAARAEGYDEAAMKAAMFDHHYVLQYHLYAAALCRHLAARLPRFDYAEHFGGVGYVFLRGVQAGEQTGLFFDRPKERLVTAINDHLGG